MNASYHGDPRPYQPPLLKTSCKYPCFTCENEGDGNGKCKQCQGFFTHVENGKCKKNNCPGGTYFKEEDLVCAPCDSAAISCKGPKPSDAITCKYGYKFVKDKCNKICTPNEWYKADTNTCVKCDSPCYGCTGAGMKCKDKCVSGFLIDPTDKTKCIVECKDK